jgi:C7-cyclitol 7-kinase
MSNPCADVQALVFDLGGTFLRCAVWNSGRGISSLRRIKIDNFLTVDADAVWSNLLSHIQTYASSVGSLVRWDSPIVISFPGPLEDRRRILQAPTLLGGNARVPDLVADVVRITGRGTHVLNDVSAAAWYLSLTANAPRFMVITISSGIGSKFFDACHPMGVVDAQPWAGEIGHLVVDDGSDAPVCDCGERGHLGGIASGRGIERAARRHATGDPSAFAHSACSLRFGATPSNLNNENHLVPAARQGDEWCLSVIRRATRPLSRMILNAAVTAGLQRVIIIGGFALSLGAVYLQILRQQIVEECRYAVLAPYLPTLIELGSDCDDACLIGAGVFAGRLLGIRV